ncbi:MAG: CYTH and CHAD domain-containing protein [Caulobacteraceae bacterium]
MTSPSHEIELKFLLTNEAFDWLKAELFEGVEPERLTSIYFDTPETNLCAQGVTLRLRQEGTNWVQTIKAKGAVSRYEDEVPAQEGRINPSRLRQAPGSPKLEGLENLAPVFQVCVDRRIRLVDFAGATIELALDEGVIDAGVGRQPVRELELELKSGELADLFAEARRTCVRPGVLLSLTSKAEAGYRLSHDAGRQPPHFDPPHLTADMSVCDAFQALAFAALGQLCANAALIAAADQPEAVHQARVALRRLRVILAAFKTLVGDARLEGVKADLKRMTVLLAEARSLDVFAKDALPEPGDGEAGAEAFAASVRQAQADVHAQVRGGVNDPAFVAGLIDLTEWIQCGPWTKAPAAAVVGDQPIGNLGERLLRHRRKRLLKHGRKLDWADPRARHKLRIQAKKMHYLIDALAPAGADKTAFMRRLKRLQGYLGDLNDIATAPATAALALGDQAPVAVALAAGLMIGERRAQDGPLVRRARRAFRKLADVSNHAFELENRK